VGGHDSKVGSTKTATGGVRWEEQENAGPRLPKSGGGKTGGVHNVEVFNGAQCEPERKKKQDGQLTFGGKVSEKGNKGNSAKVSFTNCNGDAVIEVQSRFCNQNGVHLQQKRVFKHS